MTDNANPENETTSPDPAAAAETATAEAPAAEATEAAPAAEATEAAPAPEAAEAAPAPEATTAEAPAAEATEAAAEESTDEESTDEESTDEESKGEESKGEESTDEESKGEESTDEESRGKGKKGKRNRKKREPKEPPLSPEEKARRSRETRFLGAIGLAKVTAEVKEHVQTTLGKQVLSRMKLLYDAEQIAAVLEQTREMMRLSKMLPFEDLHDPSVLHDRVQSKDRPLDPREMRKLGGTLAAARDVKAFLEELSEESSPRLRALAAHLDPVPELLEALERSISQDGRVHVRASERLEAIRTRLRALNDEINRNLEGMIREQGIGLALHSLRPVMRKDRFVLAVKGPKAGEVEGEVITKAKGGGIVYKEPAAIKQLNDEQLTLGKEEKAEQRRILGELTQLFRDAWERIERTANTLGWIDFTQAKALFALKAGFWVPQLSEGALELKDAFHPLIAKARKKDGAGAVAFSLSLGADHDVALLSGPKSGGKTVTLRTIGLCVALAQSGMPIPASEESKLPVFQGLYADIAEGRAGPAGRSAFSLHLTRVKEVLAEADESSLILLDELGNGTEPGEAAALAQAVLEALAEKKAKVAAVTHLPALKQFAFSHARAENFALGWDADEGKPSYALSQGQPGSSFSLESARRVGVPGEVMSRADALLSEQDRLGEELTAHLRTLIGQAEQRSADATAKQKEASEAVAAVERERKSIDATKQAISKEADLEMEERFLKLQRVVRKAVEEHKEGPAGQALGAMADEVKEILSHTPFEERRKKFADGLKKGELVYLIDQEIKGEVLKLNRAKRKLRIKCGSLVIDTTYDNVSWLEGNVADERSHPAPRGKRGGDEDAEVKPGHDEYGFRKGQRPVNFVGFDGPGRKKGRGGKGNDRRGGRGGNERGRGGNERGRGGNERGRGGDRRGGGGGRGPGGGGRGPGGGGRGPGGGGRR